MAAETADFTAFAGIAKALSDPIRLQMIATLAQGRACCGLADPRTRNVPGTGTPTGICVCELQEQFGLGQSRTSYHLRVLKQAGLVTEETRGKWSFYELDRRALSDALHLLQRLLKDDTSVKEPMMNDQPKCTELGCMTPAQVVECAEGSNTVCWISATIVAEDGSEVAYECCGGGGTKARFSLLRRDAPPRTVTPAEVPSSLTWVQRWMV